MNPAGNYVRSESANTDGPANKLGSQGCARSLNTPWDDGIEEMLSVRASWFAAQKRIDNKLSGPNGRPHSVQVLRDITL